MLLEYRPSWRRILKQSGKPLAIFFLFSVAVTLFFEFGYHFRFMGLPDLPISLLGSALGIFLGFRTNSAYGRWWEARILWGALVNHSRSWTRQVLSYSAAAAGQKDEAAFSQRAEDSRKEVTAWRRDMVYLAIAFAASLRDHLRGQDPLSSAEPFVSSNSLTKLRTQRNVPAALLHEMGVGAAQAADARYLTEERLLAMNNTLSELTNVLGGCERIRNTPFPRQYDYYPEVFIYGYCFLVPLAIVPDLGFPTPVLTLLVSFVLVVLNRIGKNLEDPFDQIVYGTPMTSLARVIEIDLKQRLGETDIPSPIQPKDGALV
jgi:putative membrane protein